MNSRDIQRDANDETVDGREICSVCPMRLSRPYLLGETAKPVGTRFTYALQMNTLLSYKKKILKNVRLQIYNSKEQP